MKAQDAINGQVYTLPPRGTSPEYKGAICNGWNHTHEWILFLVSDERGRRKVTIVMPGEIIQAVN